MMPAPFTDRSACPTIVCVLKSGGHYGAEHVQSLACNIRRFNPEARIVCLSDIPLDGVNVERVTLQHDLKGWFSKLEVFALDEPSYLYLDLDVVVTGRIEVDLGPGLFLLRDFGVGAVNSSVMYVRGSFKHVLQTFLGNAHGFANEYTVPEKWGDQDFIRDHASISGFLQDLAPSLASSWKRDCHYQMGWMKKPPKILVFHGRPKPEDLILRHDRERGLYVFSWRYLPKSLFKRLRHSRPH
jgi:hypothetical protein